MRYKMRVELVAERDDGTQERVTRPCNILSLSPESLKELREQLGKAAVEDAAISFSEIILGGVARQLPEMARAMFIRLNAADGSEREEQETEQPPLKKGRGLPKAEDLVCPLCGHVGLTFIKGTLFRLTDPVAHEYLCPNCKGRGWARYTSIQRGDLSIKYNDWGR